MRAVALVRKRLGAEPNDQKWAEFTVTTPKVGAVHWVSVDRRTFDHIPKWNHAFSPVFHEFVRSEPRDENQVGSSASRRDADLLLVVLHHETDSGAMMPVGAPFRWRSQEFHQPINWI